MSFSFERGEFETSTKGRKKVNSVNALMGNPEEANSCRDPRIYITTLKQSFNSLKWNTDSQEGRELTCSWEEMGRRTRPSRNWGRWWEGWWGDYIRNAGWERKEGTPGGLVDWQKSEQHHRKMEWRGERWQGGQWPTLLTDMLTKFSVLGTDGGRLGISLVNLFPCDFFPPLL